VKQYLHRAGLVVLAVLTLAGSAGAAAPRVHALIDVTVVTRPGEVLTNATVILRDGRIEAVGESDRIEVPDEARRFGGEDWWVYAGFIESWHEHAMPERELPDRDGPEEDPGLPGPGSDHVRLHPEWRVVDGLVLEDSERKALREAGLTVVALMPDRGVLRGSAALVQLGDVTPEQSVLRADLGSVANLRPRPGIGPDRYPASVMGAISAIRQALIDADFRAGQDVDERGYDPSRDALLPVVAGERPMIFQPGALVIEPRVAEICAEAQVSGVMLGTGGEWRRMGIVPRDVELILPVNFADRPEIPEEEDWIQVSLDELRAWDLDASNLALLAGEGHDFAVSTHGLDEPAELFARLRAARDHGLDEQVAVAALTTVPARIWGLEEFGTVERGRRAYLTVLSGGSLFDDDASVEMVFVDGEAIPVGRAKPERDDDEPTAEKTNWTRTARFPAEDRGAFAEPEAVVVRHATIWTAGPDGVLESADLLVEDGRIKAVGVDLDAPADAMVIDGTGMHVSPGLIDAHSHIAGVGGLNEWTVASSAMVRLRDVLNSEDRRIYQHLAGGLTTSHLLHGSSNPIGGQCQAIKLRWGADPDDLVFAEARPTIKFALGENPKRGNSHQPEWHHRYPQSRMGVDDFIRERFAAAVEYRQSVKEGVVARDLELEALLEILDDERDIHCHSYRQDEVLALMMLMEEFGGRVAVFTHILEGYKVADEMARHGAAGSTFSDWWAYKFEVYDAIPQNTTIMDERGISVSVNSDSADLGRRLNTEAAKSVRYGGTPEERALLFVTLNAASQIGAADRVGSLEPGKDADFVVWNAPPLSTRAIALQTWIEGKLYWDAKLDEGRQDALREEREALLTLAREASKKSGGAGEEAAEESHYEATAEWIWSHTELGCNGLVAEEAR